MVLQKPVYKVKEEELTQDELEQVFQIFSQWALRQEEE